MKLRELVDVQIGINNNAHVWVSDDGKLAKLNAQVDGDANKWLSLTIKDTDKLLPAYFGYAMEFVMSQFPKNMFDAGGPLDESARINGISRINALWFIITDIELLES